MDTKFDLGAEEGRPIVYVRPVEVENLPEDLQEQAQGLKTIYAVHSEDGERLAFVQSRDLAFLLARENNMEPVTVH